MWQKSGVFSMGRWHVVVILLPSILLFLASHEVKSQVNDTIIAQIANQGGFLFDRSQAPSPHKAAIYSAVLPGLGQVYNQQYWKVPILYAGIGGIIYAIHFNTKYYNLYRTAYRDFILRDPGNTSYHEIVARTRLSLDEVYGTHSAWFQRALDNQKRFYRRNRDLSYLGMVALYIANIVDATVDAHFFEFDVSDDLTLKIEPVIIKPFDEDENFGGLKLGFTF